MLKRHAEAVSAETLFRFDNLSADWLSMVRGHLVKAPVSDCLSRLRIGRGQFEGSLDDVLSLLRVDIEYDYLLNTFQAPHVEYSFRYEVEAYGNGGAINVLTVFMSNRRGQIAYGHSIIKNNVDNFEYNNF